MAQQDIPGEMSGELPQGLASDEINLLKRRARRRLIGAVVLALVAAIILPMVMDHQPAPSLKDIHIRIPSPDEGASQRIASKPVETAKLPKEEPVRPVVKEELPKPEAKAEPVEVKTEIKAESKSKSESKSEPKVEPKTDMKPKAAEETSVVKNGGSEAWEVQLGAYGEPGRVKILVGKLKQLGLPVYTENVETPNGARTRVRAGPFPTHEAADKARGRIKIIGVDGPVARKP